MKQDLEDKIKELYKRLDDETIPPSARVEIYEKIGELVKLLDLLNY